MTAGELTAGRNPMMPSKPTPSLVRAASGAALAAAAGFALLHLAPTWRTGVFMGGAAKLAGLFAGVPAERAEDGWALPLAGQPVLVTQACSATDFFLMTAALLGWHFARRTERAAFLPAAAAGALFAAIPLTVFVNSLRVVAVAQAHRWVIPRLPPAYDSFLHMLTGAAVFLPALIALNLLLEYSSHARSRVPVRA